MGSGKKSGAKKPEARDWYEKLKEFAKEGWGSFYGGGLLRMKKKKELDI